MMSIYKAVTTKSSFLLTSYSRPVWFSTGPKRFQSNVSEDEQVVDAGASSTPPTTHPSVYRCSVNNPLEHNTHHLSKFYKIDEMELKMLDPFQEALSKDCYAEFKAFGESSIMIREPAVEILNYAKNIGPDRPNTKFILYGTTEGTGKRHTLLHVMHYAKRDNRLIVHVPTAASVLKRAKEMQESGHKENRMDTPLEASLFLKRFQIQNSDLLKKLNIKTTKQYNWSARESAPEGTSFLDLIDYGVNRVKYSSDIVATLIREIKLQSTQNKFKVFVGIDQINGYFGPTRHYRSADKSDITVDEITITRAFKKLLKNDWNNSFVVGTINSHGVIIQGPRRNKRHYDNTIPHALRRRKECTLHYEGPLTPAHLLKREGFYYLEPFVPIEVPAYSINEIHNHYDYYKEVNWIQNAEAKTDSGREEIMFLSGRNPAQFMRVCRTL